MDFESFIGWGRSVRIWLTLVKPSKQVNRLVYKGALPSNNFISLLTPPNRRLALRFTYVRTILPSKAVRIYLLCAKSRITPLKQQTFPRLKLCVAHLVAHLAAKVKQDLEMNRTPTFYWLDSKIVLSWTDSRSSSYHTFVVNRIVSILETSWPDQWL